MNVYPKLTKLISLIPILTALFVGCANVQETSPDIVSNQSAAGSLNDNRDGNLITEGGLSTGDSLNAESSNTVESAEIQQRGQRIVLYDFRTENSDPPLQKFKKAEDNLVWSYAFGAKTQRNLSDFVVQRIDGAFTKPNALETLYPVNGHAADESQSYIVIYDKTIPIAKYKSDALGVLKITDLNGDGQNKMFVTSGDVWMYGEELDAQLIQIADNKIQVIKKFSEIYSSSDGMNHKTTGADVSVISYSPASGTGDFPSSYFIKHYDCTGSNGSFNPKTCRAKNGVK